MPPQINSILKQVLERIKPFEQELQEMGELVKKFTEKINNNLKKFEIDAEVFIGGSFAKKTVIKKEHYDVDVFLRFARNYEDKEISNLARKILNGIGDVSLIHGSRDYFRIKLKKDLFVELIPVIKVNKPEESLNITDLSYSHVKYINKKINSEKLREEIMIAKAFCHANHCYGAESYIKGFSGYSLELLIYHYKGFLKFIKAIAKAKKGEKIIIDIEKDFKNKNQVMMDLNSSKLQSPIILIDPTNKHRNALAALSEETLEKFKDNCVDFLKKPSIGSFEEKKTNLEEIKRKADKNKFDFVLLEATTHKQEGGIAGSKLLKFYNHLGEEIKKFFYVKEKGFNYNGKQAARFYFVVKSKEDVLISGPNIEDEKNVKIFKKKHKGYYTKKGKTYAKEIVDLSLKKFLENWMKKYKDKIKGMSVGDIKIVEE